MASRIGFQRIGLLSCCVLLVGGCTLTDPCPPAPNRFRTVDFNTEVYELDVVDGDVVPSGSYAVAGDSLAFDALGISMESVKDVYYSSADPEPSLSIVSAAYACDPKPPVSYETVVDIRITSDADYDEAHPAGSNLAALFDVVILDYGRNVFRERFDLLSYLARAPNAVDELFLIPNVPPDTNGPFSFTVTYEQEGSGLTEFEFMTDEVVLLRQDSQIPR